MNHYLDIGENAVKDSEPRAGEEESATASKRKRWQDLGLISTYTLHLYINIYI